MKPTEQIMFIRNHSHLYLLFYFYICSVRQLKYKLKKLGLSKTNQVCDEKILDILCVSVKIIFFV